MMFCSWDSFIEPDSIARLIDAFVESLDLSKFGIKEGSVEGRPGYDPKGILKLYIYGHRKGIRSSRKLAEACRINMEVRWMMGGVKPDFRTVSDFRKDNIRCMKAVFHEFNKRLSGAVEWGFTSIDGSKFQANNSKNNNFTKSKLDDRIRWLNAHTDEYMRILDDIDEQEELDDEVNLTKELVEKKLEEAKERLARYESYQKIMEDTGASQMSITDADARLMKSKNGFMVSYNAQTVIDSETHLIRDYNMTNQVTDHGQLYPTLENIKEEESEKIIETVADRGYENTRDMVECLEHGIIPHVIMEDGKDFYELEIAYEEEEADKTSKKPKELKKCLRSGKIPDAYQEVIEDIRVEEVRRKVTEDGGEKEEAKAIYGTTEEMMARAKEGYFVRDPERNLVYCPNGEILRQKCIKKNGNIRYANKNACRHCKNRNKCYRGKNEWKEIDFTKDGLEKPCREWMKAEGRGIAKERRESVKRGIFKIVKVVKLRLIPDRAKMSQRMCLSEHPFGTLKRAMGFTYFLLRGKDKVEGEFALSCLGYNFERAKNLLGFDKMMEIMAKG
jgi:transposase